VQGEHHGGVVHMFGEDVQLPLDVAIQVEFEKANLLKPG
jgi:hypothetical protein